MKKKSIPKLKLRSAERKNLRKAKSDFRGFWILLQDELEVIFDANSDRVKIHLALAEFKRPFSRRRFAEELIFPWLSIHWKNWSKKEVANVRGIWTKERPLDRSLVWKISSINCGFWVRNPEITKNWWDYYGSSRKNTKQQMDTLLIDPKTALAWSNPNSMGKSKKNDSIHTVIVVLLLEFSSFPLGNFWCSLNPEKALAPRFGKL